MFWQIIFILFVGFTIIQLVFWLVFFVRLAVYREPKKEDLDQNRVEEPVSIVICARNEAENLKENLPRFLNQNYRFYEIIVVNDNSFDKTEEILLNFKIKSPILCVINLRSESPPGKKFALTRGIQAAKHNLLLLTDADCSPDGPDWIYKMQSAVRGEVEISLGYGPYLAKKGFLNKFIRFETAYTAIQYFSFALAGIPYMGVGRNLIYRKSLFDKYGGFHNHENIASGDDDLFINQAAAGKNTSIVISPGTFVYSKPKSTWRGYYHQKSRHLTTSSEYKSLHKFMLGLLALSHFMHYALLVMLLVAGPTVKYFVILTYLVRICVVSVMYGIILNKLHEQSLIPWAPVLDAVYVLFYLVFAPSLLIGKKEKWK